MLPNETKTTIFPKKANLGERGTIFPKNSKLFTQIRTNSARLAPKQNGTLAHQNKNKLSKVTKRKTITMMIFDRNPANLINLYRSFAKVTVLPPSNERNYFSDTINKESLYFKLN